MKISRWVLFMGLLTGVGLPGWAVAAPPANDAFSSSEEISGIPTTVSGSNVDATLEDNEPRPDDWEVEDDIGFASVWYHWTPAASGMVQIDTFGSDFDTMLAVWTGDALTDLTLLAENDDQEEAGGPSAVSLDVQSGTTYRIAVYGFDEESTGTISLNLSEPAVATISGTITQQDGTTPLEGITATAYEENGSIWDVVDSGVTDTNGMYTLVVSFGGTYRVEFEALNGDYKYEVYNNATNLNTGTNINVPVDGSVSNINAALDPIWNNDAFSTPFIVSAFPATIYADNLNATLEPGEPTPRPAANASVWFSWTATMSGPVQVDTFNSTFDTLLAVWSGDVLTNLTLLAENDDYKANNTSAVFLNAVAGRTYRIAVYGFSSGTGNIVLNISNDTGFRISGTVTASDTSLPLHEVAVSAYELDGTVWNWVGTGLTDTNGNYSVGGLLAGTTNRVEFVDLNTVYQTEVFDNAPDLESGTDIVLTTSVTNINAVLFAAEPPPNDPFDSPELIATFPATITGTNLDATLEPDEPVPSISAAASVWYSWTPAASGPVQIDTIDSEFDTILVVSVGDSLTNLTPIALNDDAFGRQSIVYLNAQQGTTYRIAVYGYDETQAGSITLNLSTYTGAEIAGRVTRSNGITPVQGITASAYKRIGSDWGFVESGLTDIAGNYVIEVLIEGTYRVQFDDLSGQYLSEVYDNASDLESGADIVIPVSTTVSNINASLQTVLPPERPTIVSLQRTDSNSWNILYVGTAGNSYILQEVPSLTNQWQDVGTSYLCQPGTNTIPRNSSAPVLFWKIRDHP